MAVVNAMDRFLHEPSATLPTSTPDSFDHQTQMMNRKLALPTFLLALTLAVVAAAPPQAAAEMTYDVIQLGPLPDGRGFFGADLNNRGEVLGVSQVIDWSWRGGDPYIWRNGQWTALPQPTNGAWRQELNNRGQVLGDSRPPGDPQQQPVLPVVWDNGIATQVPFSFPWDFLIGGFNDSDDFVGAGWNFSPPVALINGQLTVLPHLFPDAPAPGAVPFDINNQGIIIGASSFWHAGARPTHAVRWVNGQVENLGTLDPMNPAEAQYNSPMAINDHGLIVGNSNGRPFIWKEGVMSPLALPDPAITYPYFLGINNHGAVVGSLIVVSQDPTAPYTNVYWDPEGRPVVMDSILSEHFPDWAYRWINGINDDGWILGGVLNPHNEVRGFLLVPVPKPSAWIADSSGNWSQMDSWDSGVPNTVGAVALFEDAITAPRTVSVDAAISVGQIEFTSGHAYTVAGPNGVTLDVATGEARINVVRGSHAIGAPLTLADNTVFTVAPDNTLLIAGPLRANAVDVTKAGAGTLAVGNIGVKKLAISGGTVAIQPSGTAAGTSVVGVLDIAGGETPTARLDLNDNAAIINYTETSPATIARQQILAGRGGAGLDKPWNGQGITSSAAASANANDPESHSVGYAENSTMPLGPYTKFRGQPVDSTSVLIAFTRTGDANLDGLVNDDDVTIIGATYAPGVSQPSWALGDFDYNGFVDDDDVTLLGAFYDPNATPLISLVPTASTEVIAVPEPKSFTIAILAAAAFFMVRTFRLCRWR